MVLKMLKLKVLGSMPWFGKGVQLTEYKRIIDKLDYIEKQFNKPMVSFDANIHALYDCLQGTEIELDDDFDWFMTLGITTYTETSGLALQFVTRILNDEYFKYDDYFKELNVINRETEFLEWYSNMDSIQLFMDRFSYMLKLYCLENPKEADIEHGEAYNENNRLELNRSTLLFFGSQHFRLVLDDYITLVRLSIDSQVRRLNGEAN